MNKKSLSRPRPFTHLLPNLLRRIVFCAAAVLILTAAFSKVSAQVSVDNSSSGGTSDTILGFSSLSWTHTVNSCSNCALYVGVSTYTQVNVATARVQSVTYGAQNLTSVGTRVSPFPAFPQSGNSSVELYRLVAPASGTATVTVTFSFPVNYAVGGANSFNGVSQTTPNSPFASSAGNSDTANVAAADSVVGDLVLDLIGTTPNAVNVAPLFGQTERYNGREFFNFAFDVGAGSTKAPTSAGATPTGWLLTSGTVWALGAVTVKQLVNTAAGASVSGRVQTFDEESIVAAYIHLENLETGAEYKALTDAKGKYSFENLPSAQLYRVSVTHPKHRFAVSEYVFMLSQALENQDFTAQQNRLKSLRK